MTPTSLKKIDVKSALPKIIVPSLMLSTSETNIDYYTCNEERKPFRDASSLDPLDLAQKNHIDERSTECWKMPQKMEFQTKRK